MLATRQRADAVEMPALDSELARQVQTNPVAFATLYERHVTPVYRYILARVGNVADAQDLTSQTFLAALESLPKYDGRGSFPGWLFGIARYKIVDHFRGRKHETDLTEADNVPMSDPTPDEAVWQQLQIERVAAKLHILAPDRAEALALRLFGGLEVAEIAKLMGKQEPAVRMLVSRGLSDLRDQLGFGVEDLS